MRSEHPEAIPHNLRVATESYTDPHAGRHAKLDTRRFAGIFPLEVPKAVSVDGDDGTYGEHSNDSGERWEFFAALDKNTSQVVSAASADASSTPSAAQRIIDRYRAVHGGDHALESATMEVMKKRLPQIPDDQRSMYTLATSTDNQSTMDMLWRPKPKVHMRRTDQRALIQAQSQAVAMMHAAGLKPTNRIQCRRRGCADILQDVEALKYHLHLHNIADTVARRNDTPVSTLRKPSLVECNASNLDTSKGSHSRSKSSHGTQCSRPTAYSPRRKLSASGLLPSLFSPRESIPEVQSAPNFTTVAKAIVFDPSLNKQSTLPVQNSEIPSMNTLIRSPGRRTRKESKAISVGTKCSTNIAMLLSPPSSPDTQGHSALTPHAKSYLPPVLNSTVEDDDCAVSPAENIHPTFEKLVRSRSPLRALSPTRAMSPIRNGIRRVLAIGHPGKFTNE